MKPYLYRLICLDDKGWDASESLWGDREYEEDRIFRTRAEALAAKREYDEFDYSSTMLDPSPGSDDYEEYLCNYRRWRQKRHRQHQPVFAVERVPSVEAAYFAWLHNDIDVFNRVLELSGASAPAGYVPGETRTLPPRYVINAWIVSLPKRALRAVLPPSLTDEMAAMLWRESARLDGASSLAHSFALWGAYYEHETDLLREAAERGLAR